MDKNYSNVNYNYYSDTMIITTSLLLTNLYVLMFGIFFKFAKVHVFPFTFEGVVNEGRLAQTSNALFQL